MKQGQNDACDTAERNRQTVEAQAGITVSLGVSSFHRDLPDKEGLVEQADRALYQAKQNGRNRGEGGLAPFSCSGVGVEHVTLLRHGNRTLVRPGRRGTFDFVLIIYQPKQ